MNKKFIRKVLLASGMMLLTGSATMATEEFIENDVTPPWGRIAIVGATEVNNVNYVDRQKVDVAIYATDDKCEDTDIKYYISTSEILDTQKVTTWYDYTPGMTHEIELPNTSSMNTIYAVFKDKNGNTSLIFSGLEQTVEYNLNATDAEMGIAANTRTYGAPFVVTSQTPIREGYFFKGWGLNAGDTDASYYAEDVIPADASIGTADKATLYAIWTTETTDLKLLADVVKVGDYVNYPVYYDNVATNGSSYIAKHKGWRVISKDVDIDGNPSEGTVNLVSAGVPMTYYHEDYSPKGILDLALNFLNTEFAISEAGFIKTGFNPYQSLTSTFTNKYTATYESDITVTYPTYINNTESATKLAGTLKVRAMTLEDVDKTYVKPSQASYTALNNSKYQDLFAIPCSDRASGYVCYYFASVSGSNDLYYKNYYNAGISNEHDKEYGVRPVVSLKPTVKTIGKDTVGAWNIEI